MQPASQRCGAAAEAAAWQRLQRCGLRLLRRNYRVRCGEIDIIARDGEVLVFVEVRLRVQAGHGGAAASVDARKRARIVRAARYFLGGPGAAWAQAPCRFDVVAIDGSQLRWIRNAFDAGDGGSAPARASRVAANRGRMPE